MSIIRLDKPRQCDVNQGEQCKSEAFVAMLSPDGHIFAMCKKHVHATKEVYEMSEEQAQYKVDDGKWYVYDRAAINGYQVRGVMRERQRGEPTDAPLGVTIEGHGGKLALSYEEAQVIQRHLNSALRAMGRTLAEQREHYEEQMREEL